MTRSRFTVLICCLVLFSVSATPREAWAWQGSSAAEPTGEAATFFGHPYVPGDLIESMAANADDLDRLELPSSLRDQEELLETLLQNLRMAAERTRNGEAEELGSDPCTPAFVSHEESVFATAEYGQKSTLDHLFSSADRVLFVRVLDVQSALLLPAPGRFVTLIEVEILEDLAGRGSTLTLSGRATYADPRYSFEIDGTEVCANRPGFHMPRPGDRLALLLRSSPYFEENYDGSLWVTNALPMAGDEILPQPYVFLDDSRGPISEAEVRAQRSLPDEPGLPSESSPEGSWGEALIHPASHPCLGLASGRIPDPQRRRHLQLCQLFRWSFRMPFQRVLRCNPPADQVSEGPERNEGLHP